MEFAISSVDLFVLLAYLAAVAAAGIWIGRGTTDLSGYFLGDRHLPWWAVAGSIVATETSTATFLSVPGIAYAQHGDMRFLQLTIGYLIGRTLIVWWLLPLYFRGSIFTAYEVLEQRFGGPTKRTASVIFLVTRNLGDGLRLFLTAIVLEIVAGLPLPLSVIVIGTLTIIYTLLGGMKAVVWNDCFQFVVYMVGGLVAGWVMLQGLPNGWASLVEFGQANEKFQMLDFQWNTADPFSFWSAVIGGMFLTLGTHGTDQMMVQRYLCARSQRHAGWALLASSVVVMIQFALFLALGVGLAAFYAANSSAAEFASNDHVFATFIVTELPYGCGLVGLVLAAVFAAAMSTLSSSINSSAASAVNDLIVWPEGKSNDAKKLRLSRWLTVVFGVIQIGVGIAAKNLATSVVTGALAIAGFSAGLLLGVFALGVLTKRVGHRSATMGLVFGLAVLCGVAFGLPNGFGIPDTITPYKLAWPWYSVVGSISTFCFAYLAHLVGADAARPSSQGT